ncbi:hypothetical protein IEQ34_001462 [Dendrobium chrysotoxum]|uniref:TLC domain-containing protein n=1 Tax=Dendrobium chrysotoxum TaxID=161865 RepID=A0AAV7H7Z8_DENCH|nr:hypothetical protein IEQ34_001462 [Dendrobium chrysotoxum]
MHACCTVKQAVWVSTPNVYYGEQSSPYTYFLAISNELHACRYGFNLCLTLGIKDIWLEDKIELIVHYIAIGGFFLAVRNEWLKCNMFHFLNVIHLVTLGAIILGRLAGVEFKSFRSYFRPFFGWLLDLRHVVIQLSNDLDYNRVIPRHSYYINNCQMQLLKCTPFFDIKEESLIV